MKALTVIYHRDFFIHNSSSRGSSSGGGGRGRSSGSILGVTTHLTSQVISVAFYSEGERSDKFCSEVLISA